MVVCLQIQGVPGIGSTTTSELAATTSTPRKGGGVLCLGNQVRLAWGSLHSLFFLFRASGLLLLLAPLNLLHSPYFLFGPLSLQVQHPLHLDPCFL